MYQPIFTPTVFIINRDKSHTWNVQSNANYIQSASSHCVLAGGLKTSVDNAAAAFSSLDIRCVITFVV